MYDKINSEIQVILGEKEVIKKYNCRNSSGDYALKKFLRELYAYEYFNTKKVDFVPRMIGYDKSECWLILENIRGVTLYDLIDAGDINHRKIIDELIKVDRYLFINKINYMHSSVKDILISRREERMYIIDFEYTYLNEYFQQILYESMFGSRMMRIKNSTSRDKFLNVLRERRNEFESYYYRKAKNAILSKLGMMRQKE